VASNEDYIRECIELAKKGAGYVSPNPLVGCVIIKDGEKVSEGYHHAFGSPHAEADAINKYKGDLTGATLYVNLEPCPHFGKTPPCADLIIEKQIKRVVLGTTDPNPLVAGKGIQKLAAAGIEVVVGILEKECGELNKFFFKYQEERLPYVTLKIAQTLDGKIADPSYGSRWITNEKSRKVVHTLRSEYDAVLVGMNTVKVDNPMLDARLVNGRIPKKIILDKNFESDINSNVFESGETILITANKNEAKEESLKSKGHKVIYLELNSEGEFPFPELLKKIGEYNIISVLVEGGSGVFSSFVRSGSFDELIIITAPKILGSGIPAIENIGVNKIEESLLLKPVEVKEMDGDIFARYIK